MIAYIKGIVIEKSIDNVIVECGGLGYEVFVSVRDIEKITKGSEVLLHTYLKISEDAHSLYGFLNKDDLLMFKKLIGINGVGPKAALSILSTLSTFDLKMAIVSEDHKAISAAQGIGPKIAKRIILDLKEKVDLNYITTVEVENTSNSGVLGEVVEALISLGYSSGEAYKAVRSIEINDSDTTEDILKIALKKMAIF
ncbi:Holliday junction branch migration protein RuvA [Lachnoanaerobaculum umeaense]|uniref:Holliday junction branch migration complex subunit RuvA n=1 Tax=Lachnoanaerobaculum umeaense TaxID=617123 RepID=A0A385Q2N0_9FIRM|nr:Holliday junction branch migration protein RuvA [Lachnoanaerobaculum umeaense]AYA99847.1 Holliday junction branch migration protein RuvA [Lachnoanaerobaculum umeaense]PZW96833.1 Holliday junction DNA helicase subunit RuvA [Lachnoanaerobaculum umeaense]